jgi:hypothetical protein
VAAGRVSQGAPWHDRRCHASARARTNSPGPTGSTDRPNSERADWKILTPTPPFQSSLGDAWLARGGVSRASAARCCASFHPGSPARAARSGAHSCTKAARSMTHRPSWMSCSLPILGWSRRMRSRPNCCCRRVTALRQSSRWGSHRYRAGDVPVRVALISLCIGEREYDRAQVCWTPTRPSAAILARCISAAYCFAQGRSAKRGTGQQAPRGCAGPCTDPYAGREIELQSNSLTLAEADFQRAMRSGADASVPRRLLAATYLRQGRPASPSPCCSR